MKEEIRNTENAEKKGRRVLSDEALAWVTGGSIETNPSGESITTKDQIGGNESTQIIEE